MAKATKATKTPKAAVQSIAAEPPQEQPAPKQRAGRFGRPPGTHKGPLSIPGQEPRKLGYRPNPLPKLKSFMQQVAQIDAKDWGTRASIRLYRLEPIIDRRNGSEVKYIARYNDPIDEDKIKHDHGSGRYRCYLNFKEPTAGEKELDQVEFDILDMSFPPKVPYSDWVDDHRNKKWAWAKPANPEEVKAAAATAATVATGNLETAYETVVKIQDSERARMYDGGPKADPLDMGLKIADKFLATNANSPVVEMIRMQLEASQKEAAAERQANRELMNRLLADAQARANAPAPAAGVAAGGMGQLKETIGFFKELLPSLKEVFPGIGEGLTAAMGRPAKTTFMDIARDMAPTAMEWIGRIGEAVVTRNGQAAAAPAAGRPAGAAANAAGNLAPGAGADSPEQRTVRWLVANNTAFMNYYRGSLNGKLTGGDFAEWTYDGYHLQPINDARIVGPVRIMDLFKSAPTWSTMAHTEPQLRKFVGEFLAWQPAPDEPEATAATPPAPAHEIDLTSEEAAVTM